MFFWWKVRLQVGDLTWSHLTAQGLFNRNACTNAVLLGHSHCTELLHQDQPTDAHGNLLQAATVEYLPQLFFSLIFLMFEGVVLWFVACFLMCVFCCCWLLYFFQKNSGLLVSLSPLWTLKLKFPVRLHACQGSVAFQLFSWEEDSTEVGSLLISERATEYPWLSWFQKSLLSLLVLLLAQWKWNWSWCCQWAKQMCVMSWSWYAGAGCSVPLSNVYVLHSSSACWVPLLGAGAEHVCGRM